MTEEHDRESDEQSLAQGESITLTVDTDSEDVDQVVLLVDDGSTGSNAPQYTLNTDIRRSEWDPTDWQRYAVESGTTALSIVDPAYPEKMRYEITKDGSGSSTYRATLVAFAGVE